MSILPELQFPRQNWADSGSSKSESTKSSQREEWSPCTYTRAAEQRISETAERLIKCVRSGRATPEVGRGLIKKQACFFIRASFLSHYNSSLEFHKRCFIQKISLDGCRIIRMSSETRLESTIQKVKAMSQGSCRGRKESGAMPSLSLPTYLRARVLLDIQNLDTTFLTRSVGPKRISFFCPQGSGPW